MLFKTNAYEALKNKTFTKHIVARFLIVLAYQMQTVSLSWWIYTKTHDPLYLGLVGLIEAIPSLSISLLAGYWADIYNRRKIIRLCLAALLISNVLMLSIAYYESLINQYIITLSFILIFIIGLIRGILGPANFAFIAQLVTREQLPNAATWNSFTWQLSMVLGPVLASSFIALYNVTFSLLIIVLFSSASFLIFSTIPEKYSLINNKSSNEPPFQALKNGIKYVFYHPILMGALTLDMLAVLFGGVTAILPAFTTEVFNAGPETLGYLRASPAIGSILMMFFLAGNPPVKNTGKILFLSVALFGVFTLFFALTTSVQWAAFFLFLTGVFDAISVVIRGTILQLFTPDNMRGRVSAVNTIFIGSSNELGSFESGLAAKLMGLVPSVIFGGSMTLIVVFIIMLRFKKLVNLQLKT